MNSNKRIEYKELASIIDEVSIEQDDLISEMFDRLITTPEYKDLLKIINDYVITNIDCYDLNLLEHYKQVILYNILTKHTQNVSGAIAHYFITDNITDK